MVPVFVLSFKHDQMFLINTPEFTIPPEIECICQIRIGQDLVQTEMNGFEKKIYWTSVSIIWWVVVTEH